MWSPKVQNYSRATFHIVLGKKRWPEEADHQLKAVAFIVNDLASQHRILAFLSGIRNIPVIKVTKGSTIGRKELSLKSVLGVLTSCIELTWCFCDNNE